MVRSGPSFARVRYIKYFFQEKNFAYLSPAFFGEKFITLCLPHVKDCIEGMATFTAFITWHKNFPPIFSAIAENFGGTGNLVGIIFGRLASTSKNKNIGGWLSSI